MQLVFCIQEGLFPWPPSLPQQPCTFMGATHRPSQWSLACEWLLFDSQCWTYAWYPSAHAPSLSFFLVVEFIILVTIKRLGDVVFPVSINFSNYLFPNQFLIFLESWTSLGKLLVYELLKVLSSLCLETPWSPFWNSEKVFFNHK